MNLSEFAAIARKAVVYLVLAVLAYFILLLLYRLGESIYLSLFPPEEPPPTVGFGVLPKLSLQQSDIEGNPTFILETATGGLPVFDDRVEVAAMADPVVTLLGEVKARELADQLDFGGNGTLSNDRKTLTFRDAIDRRTLAVNVTNQNFELTTDLAKITQLPRGRAVPGTEAVTKSQDFLIQLGLLKNGFEAGNQTTGFFAANEGAIQQVGSTSEAHFTEVNFFRSLTGVASQSYPILTPNPEKGLIRVGMTSRLVPEILNTVTINFDAAETEINKEQVETYPIKTAAQAWEEVQTQKKSSYVGVGGRLDSITITSITLAYFEDSQYQKFMQPIYVFSGVARQNTAQAEFVTYVQAVSPDWIEK